MLAPRLIRRVVLEGSSRPLLSRFLSAHGADFFPAHSFSLAALAASPASDRALVDALDNLLHSGAPPAPLRAALLALDALATPGGREELMRTNSGGILPRVTYGDPDLAILALLEHPVLASEARRATATDPVPGVTEAPLPTPRAAVPIYDLAPLRDLAALLSLEGTPAPLRAVEIHDLTVRTDEGTVVTFARPRKDLLSDLSVIEPLAQLLAHATPIAVKIYLTIDGRDRPLKVELSVKGAKIRIDFDGDDPAVVAVVRGYLRARGIERDLESPGSVAAERRSPPESAVFPRHPASETDALRALLAITG